MSSLRIKALKALRVADKKYSEGVYFFQYPLLFFGEMDGMRMNRQVNDEKNINRQAYAQIEEMARTLEKMKFGDYIEYLNDTGRVIRTNFIAGLARGFGMAVGFTLLGAVVLYFLTRLANKNLPIIGGFIAEIIKIVKQHL